MAKLDRWPNTTCTVTTVITKSEDPHVNLNELALVLAFSQGPSSVAHIGELAHLRWHEDEFSKYSTRSTIRLRAFTYITVGYCVKGKCLESRGGVVFS